MTKNTGGPAFPHEKPSWQARSDDNPFVQNHFSGMTLRDWFAGQALRARWGDGTAMTPEDAAQMAYQLADAMIAERDA